MLCSLAPDKETVFCCFFPDLEELFGFSSYQDMKKIRTYRRACGLVGQSDLLFLFVVFTLAGGNSVSLHLLCLNGDKNIKTGSNVSLW